MTDQQIGKDTNKQMNRRTGWHAGSHSDRRILLEFIIEMTLIFSMLTVVVIA